MRSLIGLSLVAFACGVVALQRMAALPPAPAAIALAGAAVLIGLGVSLPGRRPRRALVAGLVFAAAGAAGFGYAGWRAEMRLAEALPREWEGQDIRVIGVVDDLPAVTARGVRFAFAVERVVTPGVLVPWRLSLAWYASGQGEGPVADSPVVRAGERWLLTVRLKRPHGNVNPGGFDLEAWLLQQGFRATGYVHGEGVNNRRADFAGRWRDYVQRTRERVRDRIERALPAAPYAGVIVALAIGDQRAIPEAQWTVFNRTGISHLVSM